jgi:DNA polymerase I
MRTVILDIETDAIDATVVWCVGTREAGVYHSWYSSDNYKSLTVYLADADRVVMHNGVGFDWYILRDLLGITIPRHKVWDTLVASRLHDPMRRSHALKAWGTDLGSHKGDFTDFSGGLTEEMLTYMQQDVELTAKVYDTTRSVNLEAMTLEMNTQWELEDCRRSGYWFNTGKAVPLLKRMRGETEELLDQLQLAFPPELKEFKRIKLRLTKAGVPTKVATDAMNQYPYEMDSDEIVCKTWQPFKPSSAPQRIERLNAAGWNPVEKTKGYIKYLRDHDRDPQMANHWKTYGWTCSEANLATLPSTAPPGASLLATYLTLQARLSDLEEWMAVVGPDNRVHGSFASIGAWTQRCAHMKPNLANIFSPFQGTPVTAVDHVKYEYDTQLRALWGVPMGMRQVGTDADGIQLRILAHEMKSEMYRDAILKGNKDDGTDIHNVNRTALGLPHVTRDMAKTFIYAFLLGAGDEMISNILQCTTAKAKQAVERFTSSIDGLSELKNTRIPQLWKANKGFKAIDGRLVKAPSQHHMLAGMLQSGEAIVMKRALVQSMPLIRRLGGQLLTFVHDEYQHQCRPSVADQVGKIARDAIVEAGEYYGLFCPLAGQSNIGTNWRETH